MGWLESSPLFPCRTWEGRWQCHCSWPAVSLLLTHKKCQKLTPCSPHCSDGSTSGIHYTGTKLLCAVLLRKEEASSKRMQLLGGSWRSMLTIFWKSLLTLFLLPFTDGCHARYMFWLSLLVSNQGRVFILVHSIVWHYCVSFQNNFVLYIRVSFPLILWHEFKYAWMWCYIALLVCPAVSA